MMLEYKQIESKWRKRIRIVVKSDNNKNKSRLIGGLIGTQTGAQSDKEHKNSRSTRTKITISEIGKRISSGRPEGFGPLGRDEA
jgi:hypothetical protein